MRTALLALLCTSLSLSGCAWKLARANDHQKSERLATEEGRLSVETDPLAKLKSYIVVSEILLNFASESVRDGQIEQLSPFLNQYTSILKGVSEAMAAADVHRQHPPLVFKDLEITLKTQMRLLEDMNKSLTVDTRKPVEDALSLVTSLHQETLRRFLSQNSTTKGEADAHE